MLSVLCFIQTISPAFADQAPDIKTSGISVQAPAPCHCMASDGSTTEPVKKKHRLLKGMAKDLGMSANDMGKDLILAFSVQDYDPYAEKPSGNKPYVVAEATLTDGSNAQIVKFPDKSLLIKGGFADGTYACPTGAGIYTICYPNGVQGVMKILPGGGYQIARPDNTVTTISRTNENTFRISNSKIGYMGDINTDETGLNYEFSRQQ